MRVMITGASGFLGERLTKRLSKTHECYCLHRNSKSLRQSDAENEDAFHCYCDVTDDDFVASVMADTKPGVVFHLAGRSHANDRDPYAVTRANVLGTHHLLEHCRPGTRFVLASSAAVYGCAAETTATESSMPNPRSVYAASKLAAERLVQAYWNMGRISPLILRFTACCGRGQTHGLIKDVVEKLRSDSATLDLLGEEPGSTKPYLHADDAVEALVRFGFSSEPALLNISPVDEVSVAAVAERVMRVMGVRKDIRFLGAKSNWAGDDRFVSVSGREAENRGFVLKYRHSLDAVEAAVKEMV